MTKFQIILFNVCEFWRWVKDFVPRAAAGLEPVVLRQLATAALVLATGLGLADVAAWSDKVDAVLVFLTAVQAIASTYQARKLVSPVKALPDGPEGDDNPEDDFAATVPEGYATPLDDLSDGEYDPPAGQHKRED